MPLYSVQLRDDLICEASQAVLLVLQVLLMFVQLVLHILMPLHLDHITVLLQIKFDLMLVVLVHKVLPLMLCFRLKILRQNSYFILLFNFFF